MLKGQQLELAYPATPSHPRQGYKVKYNLEVAD